MAEKQPPEGHEGEPKARDGEENGKGKNGKSIADRAKEIEAALPEPAPLGDPRGTIPLPVGSTPSAKKNVEVVVELTKAHAPGAGQLDINAEHLLIVRAEYLKGIPTPKRDGEKRVIGFKYVQQLRPTWVEGLDDYLRLNGLKIVRSDEDGDAVDPENLVNIEELRGARGKDNGIA